MKHSFFIIILALTLTGCDDAKIKPSQLTCEYINNPAVIEVANPRFSWINITEEGERGQKQTGWHIRVAESKEALIAGSSLVWSYKKLISSNSVNVRYEGPALEQGRKYWWQVRVWDKNRNVSEWSDPAFFTMGLTEPSAWKAEWIGAPWQGEEALPKPSNPNLKLPAELPPPAPLLRKEFNVEKKVASAVAYTTGLGYFELYLNGSKVGEDVLVPNQTNYGKRPGLPEENIPLPDNFREYRVMYMAYDVTEKLNQGENVVGSILGNGFYNPAKYWCGAYGTPRFLFQMHLTYEDGSNEIIVSDKSWKAAKGPILMDMVYYGEHYDARLEMPGWCSPGFDDSGWQNAVVRKAPAGKLTAHTAQTDRVMEVLDPVKIEKLEEGKYKIDFGQEISGWVHMKDVTGEAGRKIEIKYLQPYSPNGENIYTMKGGSPESYHARFTWFVFREVEISGWPGEYRR
ncbi:MAG: family 78 glycoside hydrolase catalytic domain [Bacteroidales bacterium]|nr:family 78 glycoside hydrolase catalytic domain [Bacteroidales bacterium]